MFGMDVVDCFRFSYFPHIKFLGGTYEHCIGHNFRTYGIVWQSFTKIGRRMLKTVLGKKDKTTMWANAQRDGRPAEYRWRPLFKAAKFG